MAPPPLARLARAVLHRLLDIGEQAVARVAKEHLVARDASVHAPHRPMLECLQRGARLHRDLKGRSEKIAEAGGHGEQRHAVPHRRHRRRALCGVAADGDEPREVPCARGAPRGEVAQPLERR